MLELMKRYGVLTICTGLGMSAYFGLGPAIYEREHIACTPFEFDSVYQQQVETCGNPATPLFEPSTTIGTNSFFIGLLG